MPSLRSTAEKRKGPPSTGSGSIDGSKSSRTSGALNKVKKVAQKAVQIVTPVKVFGKRKRSRRADVQLSPTPSHSSLPSLGSLSSNGTSFAFEGTSSLGDDEDVDFEERPPASFRSSSVMDIDDDADDDIEEITPPIDLAEVTDIQELDEMRDNFRSGIYAFFKTDIEIEYRQGNKHHVFTCAARGCRKQVARNLTTKDRTSTGGLQKHAERCWGKDVVRDALALKDLNKAREIIKKSGQKQGLLTKAFGILAKAGRKIYSMIPLTKQQSRIAHVRWVSESMRPFEIVADDGYHHLMKTGRPDCYIPHPTTVSRDVKLVFAKTRRRLAKMLRAVTARITLATDAWTSPNHKAFVAVTAHWESEGEVQCVLLDFVEVPKSHSGVVLAQTLETVCKDYGIQDKIRNIVCDNAANNDRMIEELEASLSGFGGQADRTRCFAHVINLVAKSFLKMFEPKKPVGDNDDGGEDGDFDLEDVLAELKDIELGTPERDDPDDLFDELGTLSANDRETFWAETREIRSALTKLRKIANTIINSSTKLLPQWEALLEELGLPAKHLPRDVRTRWNSTYDMVYVALQCKRAIREITNDDDNGLAPYALTRNEWEVAENIKDVLLAFKDATTFVSRANANVASIIPIYDKLDALLASATITRRSGDINLSNPVKVACITAKRTLNRYYDRSDESKVYRVAMILHPRHKLQYFVDAGWEPRWRKTALALVQTEYDAYKAASADVEEIVDEVDVNMADSKPSDNMFDDLMSQPVSQMASDSDELKAYLAAPRENVTDVVQWWYRQRKTYPILSRVALDFHAIPPTSVEVERTFSRGRILLPHTRNRLAAQTTRALMCLGSWSRMGLIDENDLKAVTNLPEVPVDDAAAVDGDLLMPDGFDKVDFDAVD